MDKVMKTVKCDLCDLCDHEAQGKRSRHGFRRWNLIMVRRMLMWWAIPLRLRPTWWIGWLRTRHGLTLL